MPFQGVMEAVIRPTFLTTGPGPHWRCDLKTCFMTGGRLLREHVLGTLPASTSSMLVEGERGGGRHSGGSVPLQATGP